MIIAMVTCIIMYMYINFPFSEIMPFNLTNPKPRRIPTPEEV